MAKNYRCYVDRLDRWVTSVTGLYINQAKPVKSHPHEEYKV